MLIKISKDIGAIIDELAIINIKINTSSGLPKQKSKENFERLSKELKEQIGENKLREILSSEEYKDLYDSNLLVFNLIDQAKLDIGLAKDTDVANYDRFLKKAALQKKFFDS